MALRDYRRCDICSDKVFYDANLNYTHNEETGDLELEYLGDWKVICTNCARTHKCIIIEKDPE